MELNVVREVIGVIFESSMHDARKSLHQLLVKMSHTEPQFCNAVVDKIDALKLSNDQWFDLLIKIPNRIFLDNRKILSKLTTEQREQLRVEL